MKHLFTKVLLAISPMIASAKTPISNSAITPDFKIVANDQIFSANPSQTNPNGGDCMATVTLSADVTGTTDCIASDLFHYKVEIDLLGDGTIDYVASSDVSTSFLGSWQYDDTDQVYKTYLPPSSQTNFKLSLPAMAITENTKKHQVSWQMSDKCGNISDAQSLFSVVDKKAPTPYCVSVSTAIFQTNPQMIEFWAKDFDKGAFDNCSSNDELYFTFENIFPNLSRINEEHFYKLDSINNKVVNATAAEYIKGKAYRWLPSLKSAGHIWTECSNYNINVTVWDKYFNSDFCTVVFKGICEQNSCQNITTVKTFKGQPLSNVAIQIDANFPEYPKLYFTDSKGICKNDKFYMDRNYTISASYNKKDRKGITYADYKLLENHIKGTKPFSQPWQLIAADLDRNGMIDDKDLKLLKETLNNTYLTEWVFVTDYDSLTTINWYNYKIMIIDAQCHDNKITNFFTAIKLGDINGDALDTVVDDIKVSEEILSDTATWRLQSGSDDLLKAQPNPFSDQTTITFGLEKAQNVKLHITNIAGMEVFKTIINAQSGENQYIINESQIGNDHLFIVRIQGDFGSKIARLVKVD